MSQSPFNDRFKQIVVQRQGESAIVSQEQIISYDALSQKALKYATFFKNQRLQRQAICLLIDDIQEHITAIIGVLLSGNYYFSLEREGLQKTEYYFEEVRCAGFFFDGINPFPTQKNCWSTLDLPLYPLTYDELPYVKSQDSACLFATSGSTGSPKLVLHTHQSLWTDTQRQINDNQIIADDRIDLLFSLVFSASLACIFPALLTGASIFPLSLRKYTVGILPDFWQRNKISFSTVSSSTFRILLKLSTDYTVLKELRLISIGAEPILLTDITGFQERFHPNCFLQIAYACTETRTISEFKVTTHTPISPMMASVGKPVVGREVLIMNDLGKVLPNNTTGEIVVKARFIPHEYHQNISQSRISFQQDANGFVYYHTQDSGFLDNDGYLYWTGRLNNEIKINGFKANLTQIEQFILMSKGVTQAIVVQNKKTRYPRLLAFLKVDPSFDLSLLRVGIAQHLPLFLLPDHYEIVVEFPQTPSGKIDRIAMEKFPLNRVSILNNDDASILGKIIDTWKIVLENPMIEPYDDFFYDAGGDSLTCLLFVDLFEKKFKIILPSTIVYTFRSPKLLAQYIENFQNASQVSLLQINQSLVNRKNIYFIPPLWNNYEIYNGFYEALSNYYNLYFIFYSPTLPDNTLVPFESLKRQISGLIIENTPSVVVGYSFGGVLAQLVAATVPNVEVLVLLDVPLYEEASLKNEILYDLANLGLNLRQLKQNFSWSYLRNKIFQVSQRYHFYVKKNPLKYKLNKADTPQQKTNAMHQYYLQQNPMKVSFKGKTVWVGAKNNGFGHHSMMRWKPYLTGEIKPYLLEATHKTILESPHLDFILSLIKQLI